MRTDDTLVRVTVVGRVWACEWIGRGEPVTVRYDGTPDTLWIPRPEFLD